MAKFGYQVGKPVSERFAPPPRTREAGRAAPQDYSTPATFTPYTSTPPAAAPAPALEGPRKRVGTDDVIYFSAQLAVMVDTGVPLTESLEAIADQTEHTGVKALVCELCEEIRGGGEFSASLEKRPKIFPRLFSALMKASEASGKMGMMLQRASEYLQEERDTRKKVKGALIYPIFMLSFCVLVVTGMLVFVLPRFEKIYAGKGVTLPLPTRLLLGISSTLSSYWYVLLPGLAGLGVGAYYFLRSPKGQIFLDHVRIRFPILGPMYRKACLARCLRAMATMITAGVSVLDMLAITAQVAGNSLYADIWAKLAQGVERGSSLSDQLLQHRLVPRTITQMISAGEKTGRLAMVMDRVAGFCESDLRQAVRTVTNMIEPIMIIVMGLVIGAIALALLLPVFSISRVVAR
jgi:type IV pilus assembly protein PilC